MKKYVRLQITPTSISGEWQVGSSGSSIFHLIYALRRCAEIHIGKLSAKADSESRTKTSKRVLNLCSLLLSVLFIFSFFNTSLAAESKEAKDFVKAFSLEIVNSDDNVGYEKWSNAEVFYGYELFGEDRNTTVADLYYLKNNGENVGYLIVTNAPLGVTEFSAGKSPYDVAMRSIPSKDIKRLYVNGWAYILSGNVCYDLSLSGKIINTVDMKKSDIAKNIGLGNLSLPYIPNSIDVDKTDNVIDAYKVSKYKENMLEGIIIEKINNYFVLESNTEKFGGSTPSNFDFSDFKVGDNVRAYHTGEILEIYPPQIKEVIKIEKVLAK